MPVRTALLCGNAMWHSCAVLANPTRDAHVSTQNQKANTTVVHRISTGEENLGHGHTPAPACGTKTRTSSSALVLKFNFELKIRIRAIFSGKISNTNSY